VGCAACLCLSFAATASESKVPVLKADDPSWKMDFSAAELLAVQQDRRKKPLQTYALESIEQLAGRPLMGSTFIKLPTGESGGTPENPKSVKFNSMDLFLSISFFPEFWEDKPIILV